MLIGMQILGLSGRISLQGSKKKMIRKANEILRAAFKFGRGVHFALRCKMQKPRENLYNKKKLAV